MVCDKNLSMCGAKSTEIRTARGRGPVRTELLWEALILGKQGISGAQMLLRESVGGSNS